VYHEFVDKTSALEAIATLPEIVKRYQPFLRTIQSVRDGWLVQDGINFHN
jgi:septal ring-binding cell division protein DamX